MIKLIVVISCAYLALARPQLNDPSTTSATILEYTQADDGIGNFNFAFKTSDGINEEAQGNLKDITVPKYDENGQRVGDEQAKGLVQTGSYSYLSPEGETISVKWVAGKN